MKYGSKKITKAGNIALTSSDKNEVDQAIEIIKDWRSLHLPAINELQGLLLFLFDNNKIRIYSVSQRLKRLSSILNKLDRNPSSGLGTMQDIGGLRIVVPTIDSLNKAKSVLSNYTLDHFVLAKSPVDYIENPNNKSGYRSIHYIYIYRSIDPDLDGMKIEFQLRTKLQHSWAMAVETAELITGTALKSNQGDDNWIEFFRTASSLFAIKENAPILSEHIMQGQNMKSLMIKLYKMNRKYNFNDTLKALNVSCSHAKRSNYQDGYYILSINFETQRVSVKAFPKENEDAAYALYSRLEKNVESSKNAVVLVSVPKMQQLQEAYPSYFLNTGMFLHAVDVMMNNCEKNGWVV